MIMKVSNSITITSEEDLVRYWLVVRPDAIKINKYGQLSDQYIECQVMKQVGEQTPTVTSERQVKYHSSSNTSLKWYSGAVKVSTNDEWVKFHLYDDNLEIETKTVIITKDGADGNPGDKGATGARPRYSTWEENKKYLQGDVNEEYYDIVLNEKNNAFYVCVKSHTSSSNNQPPNTTYWRQSFNNPFITVKTLAAQTIAAGQIDCAGTTTTNTLVAKNVDISGKITATSGQIGDFYIRNGILTTGFEKLSDNGLFISKEGIMIRGGGNNQKMENYFDYSGFKLGAGATFGHLSLTSQRISGSYGTVDFYSGLVVVSNTVKYIVMPVMETNNGRMFFLHLRGTTEIRSINPVYQSNNASLWTNRDSYYRQTFNARSMIFVSDGSSWYCFATWYWG